MKQTIASAINNSILINQGGFAHVYLVRLAEPVNNEYQAVLKRIAVSDKSGFNTVLNEVNFMVSN